jgi:ATP-dependent helicase HrpA
MRAIAELEAAHRKVLDSWPRGRALPASLREVPWLLEELRVNQFAQGLGTRGQVSAKRIRRALDEAATAPMR